MVQHNVLAMSGRAVEAAGDVDVLLLDKTGTITLGNRQATEFVPAPGVTVQDLADAAQLSSLADETPEGRSIVVLAKQYGIRERELHELPARRVRPLHRPDPHERREHGRPADSARARPSRSRTGSASNGREPHPAVNEAVDKISRSGGTPLVVADQQRVLGVDPPQGHRQGRPARPVHSGSGPWASRR